jgi:hypothetical protein
LPSAPSTPESALPPAGWYPDPAAPHARRYWDGHAWTEGVQQHSTPSPGTERETLPET